MNPNYLQLLDLRRQEMNRSKENYLFALKILGRALSELNPLAEEERITRLWAQAISCRNTYRRAMRDYHDLLPLAEKGD
jgi:hypothetical protein